MLDIRVPERMENHMGKSVVLDELVKGPVDDLAFHRASVAGAKHKIIVDVFVTPNRSFSSSISAFLSTSILATVLGR